MSTRVFTTLNGGWYVDSDDPATPVAKVDTEAWADTDGAEGETTFIALCPRCDARLRLRDTEDRDGHGPQRTGLEYQEHFYQEHTLPELRYQEQREDTP